MKSIDKIGKELVEMCRSGRHEEVVKVIISDKTLERHITTLCKGDKVKTQSIKHDTIISFVRTCLKPSFELTSPPMGYLKTIAKNYCLLSQRKKNLNTIELTDDLAFFNEVHFYDSERKTILSNILKEISEECQSILRMWAMRFKLKEIAVKLSISSEAYTKKKKQICLKKLIAIVENNPKLKEELKLYV